MPGAATCGNCGKGTRHCQRHSIGGSFPGFRHLLRLAANLGTAANPLRSCAVYFPLAGKARSDSFHTGVPRGSPLGAGLGRRQPQPQNRKGRTLSSPPVVQGRSIQRAETLGQRPDPKVNVHVGAQSPELPHGSERSACAVHSAGVPHPASQEVLLHLCGVSSYVELVPLPEPLAVGSGFFPCQHRLSLHITFDYRRRSQPEISLPSRRIRPAFGAERVSGNT